MPHSKNKQIVGLVGYAGSGKDTAAQILINQGWAKIGFANALRELIGTLVGIQPHLLNSQELKQQECPQFPGYTYRQILQIAGTEWVRSLNPDFWVEEAKRRIDFQSRQNTDGVVLTDVRFLNEAVAIMEWGGILIAIERPGVGAVNGHASEKEIGGIIRDYCEAKIFNSGTVEELQETLVKVIDAFSEASLPNPLIPEERS
jgi:hypothetical protein